MANNPYVNKVEFGNQAVMDISDTTATANDVLAGKKFYSASGAPTTGTLVPGTITEVQVNGTSVATSGIANIPAASSSEYGVTKLNNTTSSTSTSEAATAAVAKQLKDKIGNVTDTDLQSQVDSLIRTFTLQNVTDLITFTSNVDTSEWREKNAYKFGPIVVLSFAFRVATTVSGVKFASVDSSLLPRMTVRCIVNERDANKYDYGGIATDGNELYVHNLSKYANGYIVGSIVWVV